MRSDHAQKNDQQAIQQPQWSAPHGRCTNRNRQGSKLDLFGGFGV